MDDISNTSLNNNVACIMAPATPGSADKSVVPQYQWYKEGYEKLRKVIQMHAIRVVHLKFFIEVLCE